MASPTNNMDGDESDIDMEQDTQIKMASIMGSNSRVMCSESIANNMQQDDEDDMNENDQQPHFPKLSALQANGNRSEYRRVRCPPHRYTPLRDHWEQILTPLVEYLKLQVRH
jgi:hypothetical protein